MDKKTRNDFFRKRTFLNPISTGHTEYILVEAESSCNGEYKWGHYMLTLADSRRRVQLEFFLGSKRRRRESLKKIDLLMLHLDQFRNVLRTEAGLIELHEAKSKSKPRKTSHDTHKRKKGARK